MTYVGKGNRRALNVVLSKILDHVLQEDRAVCHGTVNGDLRTISAGQDDLGELDVRHCDRGIARNRVCQLLACVLERRKACKPTWSKVVMT